MKQRLILLRSCLPALVAILFTPFVHGTQEEIVVEKAPVSTEEFIALRDKIATRPEGGVVLFVLAMKTYTQDEKLGSEWLTIALDRSKLRESPGGYKGFKPATSWDYFLRKLKENPHWANSYIAGTSPEKHYAAKPPYKFHLSQNKYSQVADDRIKVFIVCSGADTPRPVTLQKNNRGIWKVLEASTLFVGMRDPGPAVDDDL